MGIESGKDKNGLAIGMVSYPIHDIERNRIPLWMTIHPHVFTRFDLIRSTGAGAKPLYPSVEFPMPNIMDDNTSHSYTDDLTVEDGYSNPGVEVKNLQSTTGSSLTAATVAASRILDPTTEQDLMMAGRKVMDFRYLEYIGSSLKSKIYSWTFFPPDTASSKMLNAIAYRLEALSYPRASVKYDRMFHPAYFTFDFKTMSGHPAQTWSALPGPSVITKLNVSRTPLKMPYPMGLGFNPSAWQITIEFTEIEPKVRTPKGGALLPRSIAIRNGAAAGGTEITDEF